MHYWLLWSFDVYRNIMKSGEMKHEMTLFHTIGPNRNVLFQTHLLFVTMCDIIGYAASLYLVMLQEIFAYKRQIFHVFLILLTRMLEELNLDFYLGYLGLWMNFGTECNALKLCWMEFSPGT